MKMHAQKTTQHKPLPAAEHRRAMSVLRALRFACLWTSLCAAAASGALAQTSKPPLPRNQSAAAGPPQSDYVRPDFSQRFRNYLSSTFGPVEMTRVVFGAAISQADNVPPDWGQGWGPYGRRVASHLGSAMAGQTADFLLSSALGQDNKFYPCRCRGIWNRLRHALISSVTARVGRDGRRVFSAPAILSPYAAGFATLAWYPPRFGPKDAFRTGNYNLLTAVGTKIALEFLHPLLVKLRRRRAF